MLEPDDEDRAAAALLRTFVYGTLPITLLWAAAASLATPAAAARTFAHALVFCALGVCALVAMRHGWTRLAVRGMSVAFFLVVSASAYSQGGVRAPAFGAFAAIILMAGVLWSDVAAFAMAAAAAAVGGALVWLELRGALPARATPDTAFGRWFAGCLVFGTVATLQFLSSRALRHSERRYRNIFESAAVALFEANLTAVEALRRELMQAHAGVSSAAALLDTDASLVDAVAERIVLLDANAAALRLVGRQRVDELAGPLSLRFRPDNRKQLAELALALLESRDVVQRELTLKKPAEPPRRVLVTGRAPEPHEGYDSVIVSSVDVTEQRAVEARSRTAQRLELIGRFAGGVAHDFNNALVVITSWVSLLRRPQRGSGELAQGLDAIEKSAARAADITRQLLSIGRRQVQAPRPTLISTVVDETVHAISRLLPADIRVKASHDGEQLALVDGGQLQQVLLNLALNARDAMPSGGELSFQTGLAEAAAVRELGGEGEYAVIRVIDTGTGMDQATLEHLFEPFFTTKPEGSGTGLGLATAQAIVSGAGGRLAVRSAKGAGTTFSVYLPLAQAPRVPTDRPAPRSAQAQGRSVLFVEDDALVREVLVQALQDAGFTVHAAGDADRALALASELHAAGAAVDLLCTDGILPGMPTRELIDAIGGLYPRAPVLVCSGHVEEELLRRRIERGDFSFLAKPFTPDELLGRLHELLSRP